jgi:hypothetical protein
MKILLGDFKDKISREDIFKSTFEKDNGISLG